MTISLKQEGVANSVIESATIPLTAGVDEYVPWDMQIHNIGETGIFGGAIVNYSGPGSIVILWQGQELEMPADPTQAFILHYAEAQPNCTRLNASGQIKFMAEGTYKIQVHGVHPENSAWITDDYREFVVEVSGVPPEEYCAVKGIVTGFFGMAVGGAVVTLNGEKRETNAAGEYAFISLQTGSYKLTIEKEPWYEPFEKDLTLTEAGKEYIEDVGLSVKTYIKIGLPLGVIGGIGGVVVVAKARAPAEVYKVPPGYEVVPKAPPGYRLVKA